MRLYFRILAIALLCGFQWASAKQRRLPPSSFREHLIATGLQRGYQVVPIDLNRDGRLDLLTLASGLTQLIWFENPGWERHTIEPSFEGLINVAAVDDPDREFPSLIVAHGFSNRPERSPGVLSLLEFSQGKWSVREIDRLSTFHRLRWVDIDGTGEPVLVNAPLAGSASRAPDYEDTVPLVFYRPGDWKRQVISSQLRGVMHGVTAFDWDGDGRDEILTASFLGVHLFNRGQPGRWSAVLLARGHQESWPNSGASKVAVGRLGKNLFFATIEPWHGHTVALYSRRSKVWQRQVLDYSLIDGHVLITADLNGDGNDEVIAGFRGEGRSVYIYWAEQGGKTRRWSRRVLDEGGIGAAGCAAADLNQDGRPDLVCIGASTANLKWYENLGPGPSGAGLPASAPQFGRDD